MPGRKADSKKRSARQHSGGEPAPNISIQPPPGDASAKLAPPPPVLHAPPPLSAAGRQISDIHSESAAKPRLTPAPTLKVAAKRGWKSRFYNKLASAPVVFVLATIVCPGLLLGMRDSIVAAAPVMAPVYTAVGMPVNLDGLDLRNVTSVLRDEGGASHLLVKGEIVNLRRRAGSLPNLQLVLHNARGHAMYRWQAPSPHKRIDAKAAVRFVARLDSPPEKASAVSVRFAGRGN